VMPTDSSPRAAGACEPECATGLEVREVTGPYMGLAVPMAGSLAALAAMSAGTLGLGPIRGSWRALP
ncbi:MAG: hypothetical protein JW940_19465, partial [Polyangiaceae bacterium]|nr:hypothetical protein [Polyangiaceae bacterium]